MPIKRTASKKKTAVKKKAPAKKKAAVKKITKKVAKKKIAPKKPTKKITKKKVAAKKVVVKKPAKKKVAAKKPAKKVAKKKITKKKVIVKKTVKKKVVAKKLVKKVIKKKAPAKKKAAVKKNIKKKIAVKKTAKKVIKKKVAVKKTVTKKPVAKKVASKKAVVKAPVKKTSKKPIKKTAIKANKKEVKITMPKEPKIELPKVTEPAPSINKKTVAEKIEAKKAAPMLINTVYDHKIVGPVPSILPYQAKQGEEYMNEAQLEHFKDVLAAWRLQVMEGVDKTVVHLRDDAENYADPNDRATQEEEFSLELRTRDRERKLLKKIEKAIKCIREDDFGYCDACGVEIGLPRLEVRPTATQCIDCKTFEEIRERQTTL